MNVLLIKSSSLGDILHSLPALTDAMQQIAGIRFDWVVEEGFREVPAWHPAVAEVIPVAFRRWRRRPVHALGTGEPQALVGKLRARPYDRIIDAQGLIKSAVLTRLARGSRSGFAGNSAREPLAALAYQHKCVIARQQHAMVRVRRLFACALDYPLPAAPPDYGLDERFGSAPGRDYVVFMHGTTWPSKHWPDEHWQALGMLAAAVGLGVRLPWSDATEYRRACRLAAGHAAIEVMPQQTLGELAGVIKGARGVVGVDTGLVHLAAALGVPCITLYGATDPALTGNQGHHQLQMHANFPCAPCLKRTCRYRGNSLVQPACFGTLSPEAVWSALQRLMSDHPG